MFSLTQFILLAPILLFSMVAHEYAHGYVAYRNGDMTAYQLGRLTWNPLKHIDPFMTILLPVLLYMSGGPILGGAKPVPVNPRNYRNFKRGDIEVSLAGIVTNIILAILCAALIPPLGMLGRAIPATAPALAILQQMFMGGIWINFVLAIFNLLPIPPLDGSHVMKYLLPPRWSLAYQRFSVYGLFLIYGLLLFGRSFFAAWMKPAIMATGLLWYSVQKFMLPVPFPL